MSVYKCKCGFEDDETCKCPKCGNVTESFESVVNKTKPKKSKKKAK